MTKAIQKKIERYLNILKPTPLGILLDEVAKYNQIIEKIGFIDQLEEAGNPVAIQNRPGVLETLQQIRTELLRALKTDRVFRENPHVTLEDFSLDLFSWETVELAEQAQQYEQIINEALEIGFRVRDEIKRWYLE